uniref:ATP synthase subunit a n=1 Tax=Bipes tridactylus TaxID=273520 RepID=Q66SR6_9SAUR|nr:ATP synthase F0 subunit 6 [Bipes tridactylus]AAT08547.1 ATP synthase F0 subunit 6 [Bipes tridactylus]
MMLAYFDQFATPTILGLPLIIMAVLAPIPLLPSTNRLIQNRMRTLSNQTMTAMAQQIFRPLPSMAHKWASPYIALLFMLLTMNLLGLLPYTFTPTTQLSINLSLAVPLWLATVLIGLRLHTTHAISHMLPEGTPTPLIPMLVMIETISLFIRPLALAVRLTANLTAGHLLLQLISSATMYMIHLSATPSSLLIMVLLLLTMLELAVAIIQAYVFVLLLSLYLQENT